MPVVVTLTAPVIVEMCISNTANALVRSWTSASKSWVTDWVAGGVVDKLLTGLAGVVGVADTSAIHVLRGIWHTGDTVVVGLPTTPAIASVVAGIIKSHVTAKSSVVHIALTSTELVEMCVLHTADAVHIGWTSAASEALWMAILGLVVWLWVPDFATLADPVWIALTLF
jgi:hypothetical protein